MDSSQQARIGRGAENHAQKRMNAWTRRKCRKEKRSVASLGKGKIIKYLEISLFVSYFSCLFFIFYVYTCVSNERRLKINIKCILYNLKWVSRLDNVQKGKRARWQRSSFSATNKTSVVHETKCIDAFWIYMNFRTKDIAQRKNCIQHKDFICFIAFERCSWITWQRCNLKVEVLVLHFDKHNVK